MIQNIMNDKNCYRKKYCLFGFNIQIFSSLQMNGNIELKLTSLVTCISSFQIIEPDFNFSQHFVSFKKINWHLVKLNKLVHNTFF